MWMQMKGATSWPTGPWGPPTSFSLPCCWLDGEDPSACRGRSMELWMGMRKGVCHGTTCTALPIIGKLTLIHGRQLRFGDFFVTAASVTNSGETRKHRCWRRPLKGALAPFPNMHVHTHTHTHTHTTICRRLRQHNKLCLSLFLELQILCPIHKLFSVQFSHLVVSDSATRPGS